MINVSFEKREGALVGFKISGHAGYDDYGSDIVCASVTSAVQLTVNAVCEILKCKADVKVLDNEITLRLSCYEKEAVSFLEALHLHLEILSQDYRGTIKITETEV